MNKSRLAVVVLLIPLSGCASVGHILATIIGIIGLFLFCATFEKSGVVAFIAVAYLMISDGSCQDAFRDPDQVQAEYEQKRLEEMNNDPHYEFLRRKQAIQTKRQNSRQEAKTRAKKSVK